jgi:hypothetical protein
MEVVVFSNTKDKKTEAFKLGTKEFVVSRELGSTGLAHATYCS